MDKEQLKVKLATLEANEKIKRDELGVATSAAQVAREELAEFGKPRITEDVAVDLVANICRVFSEALGNIDGSDLEVDLCLEYDNRITIDGINGLDDIDEPADEIHDVLADVFNIVDDGDDLIAHVDMTIPACR
jgi:hypothetical protein